MENSKIEPIKIPQASYEAVKISGIVVDVRPADNKDAQMFNLEKSLKIFKKKLEKDNILREIKERRYYTKPSAVKRAEAKKLKGKKR